jgi:hypothetical protein
LHCHRSSTAGAGSAFVQHRRQREGWRCILERFPEKLPPASLNLSTRIALYTYGYRNVHELGPHVDIDASKLEFDSSCADRPCETTPAEYERAERMLRGRIRTGQP